MYPQLHASRPDPYPPLHQPPPEVVTPVGCRRAVAAVLACVACLAVGQGRAAARQPGFFGVTSSTGLAADDFARMGDLGLTLRVPLYWFQVEPRPGEFDFSGFDRTVAE